MNPNENLWPLVLQVAENDCGVSCLNMIAKYYGLDQNLTFDTDLLPYKGISMFDLSVTAENMGFTTYSIEASVLFLRNRVILPCISYIRDNHFVVIYHIHDEHIFIGDPNQGILRQPLDVFAKQWLRGDEDLGMLLLIEPYKAGL